MSDILLLDWAIMAISLFNTIMLTWLGLTVVFNADRRDWGVWIATAGLLLGALFFVSHSAKESRTAAVIKRMPASSMGCLKSASTASLSR